MVLMKSPDYQGRSLSDLAELIVQPMTRGQMAIARGKLQDGRVYPIAMATIARVSDDVHNASKKSKTAPRPVGDDWASGSNVWVSTMEAPKEFHDGFLAKLKAGFAKDDTLHAVMDGKIVTL